MKFQQLFVGQFFYIYIPVVRIHTPNEQDDIRMWAEKIDRDHYRISGHNSSGEAIEYTDEEIYTI